MQAASSGAGAPVGLGARRPAFDPAAPPWRFPAQQPRPTRDAGAFRTILRNLQEPSSEPDGAASPPWEVSGPSEAPKGLAGLRWAAEQLEAQLWAQLLQEALKPSQDGLFGPGFAGQVYGDWFSQAVATLVVKSGAGQLARLLVEEFSSALTGDHPSERNRGEARGVARSIEA